jgi:hypothetical protein
MAPNEVVDSARKMLADDPGLAEAVRSAWNRVLNKIEARALAARPKPKSFEVHHETEIARLCFLTAVVEGRSLNSAEDAALQRVGLRPKAG